MLAPVDMARTCIALNDREARNARCGKPARVIVKMNALVDPAVIQALYRASRRGVEIDLIVRGQCTLVPGLRGVSSRIRVRSVVGRFLEHSRIFYFENGGQPEVYLGSADWMPRNLYERVEVLFPLKDAVIRERVCTEILGAYLSDTCKARLLGSHGGYSRVRAGPKGLAVNAQDHLLRVAASADGASRVRAMKVTEVVDSTPGMTASDNRRDELDDAGRGDV
jgi:polyphosphate kinase